MRQMIDFRDYLIEKFSDIDKALSFLEVALEECEKDPDGAALYYGFSAAVEAQGGVQKFALKTHSTPQAVSDALLSKDEIQIAELLKKQILVRRGKEKDIAQNEVLPKWKKVVISEVATVVTGKTPPTAVKSNYDGKVPFVSPADLGSTKYIQCAQKTLSIKGSKLSPVIPAGSTLFTCIGSTIGKTGIASIELRTNQQINSAIPNNIDEEYLYYALSFISPKIKKLAAVQAIPIINKTGFENQIIRIPECRNIQKAIASLLETWDTAIEKIEALIAAKEKRFKWLLKTLISDQQDNPEWQQVKLVDACEVIVSPVDKKTVDGELPVKLCNYTDVYYNNAIDSKINFMAATAKPREIEKFSIITDDVIITKDSETPDDIGVPAYVKETIDNLLCGYHLTILRPKKQTIGKYVCYALTSPRVKYDFYRFANGITRFGLTIESYQKIKIPLPPPLEQKRIANILDTAKEEVEFLKQLAEQYRTQKRGLMQKLLTGEWRINSN